jgi:chemotaxis protein MotB
VGRFTQSFNAATQWEVLQGHGRGLLQVDPSQAPPEMTAAPILSPPLALVDMDAGTMTLRGLLTERLEGKAKLEGLEIEEIHGELVLRLPEHLLFDNAQAILREEGRAALGAVEDVLHDRAVRIRIEGHTDSVPIQTAQFPTNWELSTARATACVRYMLESKRIEPQRLSAAGYGEHHPVGDNATADGRARNRRVDIVISVDEPTAQANKETTL